MNECSDNVQPSIGQVCLNEKFKLDDFRFNGLKRSARQTTTILKASIINEEIQKIRNIRKIEHNFEAMMKGIPKEGVIDGEECTNFGCSCLNGRNVL